MAKAFVVFELGLHLVDRTLFRPYPLLTRGLTIFYYCWIAWTEHPYNVQLCLSIIVSH